MTFIPKFYKAIQRKEIYKSISLLNIDDQKGIENKKSIPKFYKNLFMWLSMFTD